MATPPQPPAAIIQYSLESLYVDQQYDLVVDAIPAVLAWLPDVSPPFAFVLANDSADAGGGDVRLELGWDLNALRSYSPEVEARALRMRHGTSAQREHVTELAAYGLALAAATALLPGRRFVAWNKGIAPDILYDATPGALRGVEVAGRSRGGWGALRLVREGKPAVRGRKARGHKRGRRGRPAIPGKRQELVERDDIVEVHLSLWSARPQVSEFFQVKP